MLKISILFLIFSISFSASEIRKIEGIEGQIKLINFDSDYKNSYIVSNYNKSDWFYKLDNKQNIILTKNFNQVLNVLINSENDIYVFSYDITGTDYRSIWNLKNNSKKFKLISYFKKPVTQELNAFLDKDDNIFFNTKHGAAMIKPQQNIILALGNFENKFFTRYLVDDSGDVYFKTLNQYGDERNVIVYGDAKNQSVPEGKDVPYFKGEEINVGQAKNSQSYLGRFGTYVYTNSRSNQYSHTDYFYEDYDHRQRKSSPRTSYIKKINENSEEILLSEYDTVYEILHETENRLFVISEKSGNYYNIYYITRDNEIVAIKEVFKNPKINSSLCTSDKDGNVYFVNQKSIISLKENATESTNIDIPSDKDVSYILIDDNNDLWVIAGDLYVVKNGTESASRLDSVPMGVNPLMKENKLTNEIFVASENGLFVCKN